MSARSKFGSRAMQVGLTVGVDCRSFEVVSSVVVVPSGLAGGCSLFEFLASV